MQRRIERQIRTDTRLKKAYEAAGLEKDAQNSKIRLRQLNKKYREFSKAAGLPEQRERMKIRYVDDASKAKAAKRLEKTAESGIIKTDIKPVGGSGVQTIGKIDVKKYRVVSSDIRTSEVIITDERIRHIQERHPNDFERYSSYLKEIVENPDYILESKKPNTAFVLKEISEAGERFQVILRLAVSEDPAGYKNSIITFLKVEDKRYLRYLRTKKILYKSE